MCGIAGYIGFQEVQLIEMMLDRLAHRGPDDRGTFSDNTTTMGQNRLSIIGVQNGHQPLFNETKSICLVVNGEIYNYQELRHELIEKRHVFTTDTDSEVIIHAYEEFGENCIHKLRGMFAFALWDANKKQLWLARDRLGIKPLYYWHQDNKIVFASELKAMIVYSGIKKELDYDGLLDVLVFRYARNPRTPLKNIFKVKPGEYLLFHNGKVKKERYWRFRINESIDSLTEAKKLIGESFEDSVRIHMVSDVPIGFMLSGGIDSSAIVAIASKFTDQATSFSIGFESEKDSELGFAQIVATQFNTKHETIELTAKDIKALPEVIWYNDEPVGGPSSLAFFQLLGSIKNLPKVILFGHGADEILSGYEQLKIFRLCSKVFAIPMVRPFLLFIAIVLNKIFPFDYLFHRLRLLLTSFEKSKSDAYLQLISVSSHDELSKILQPHLQDKIKSHHESVRQDLAQVFAENSNYLNGILQFEVENWLADDINHRLDRMTMAKSVEARVPFLDHIFVEQTAKLAFDLKLSGNDEKFILKEVFRGILPDVIVNRKKQRFNTPINRFFGERFPKIVQNFLNEDNYLNREIFNTVELRKLLDYENRISYRLLLKRNKLSAQFFARPLWNYMVFQFWYKMYVENVPVDQLNIYLEAS